MATKPKKPPLTHFLCIPLVTATSAPQWQASLDRFILDATATSATGNDTTHKEPSNPIPREHTAGTGESDHRRKHPEYPLRPVASEHAVAGEDSSSAQNAVENARATSSGVREEPTVSASGSMLGPSSSLASHPGPRLPARAVRPLHSLHLTLGVMSLRERARVDEATSLLRELDVAGMLRTGGWSTSVDLLPVFCIVSAMRFTLGICSLPGGARWNKVISGLVLADGVAAV